MSDNKNTSNDNKAATSVPATATVAQVAALQDSKVPVKKVYPAEALVKSASGNANIHQITGATIDGRPTRIKLDAFARAQLDAGKWVIEA